MRSIGALLFGAFIGHAVADEDDYDPDAVIHHHSYVPGGVYGLAATCGYVFTGGSRSGGRMSDYCPDCVDILGYVPGHGPSDDDDEDEDYFDDDEDDDEDDEDDDEDDEKNEGAI